MTVAGYLLYHQSPKTVPYKNYRSMPCLSRVRRIPHYAIRLGSDLYTRIAPGALQARQKDLSKVSYAGVILTIQQVRIITVGEYTKSIRYIFR